MPRSNIDRSTQTFPVVERDNVKVGQLFALRKKSGRTSTKTYGAIGQNGHNLSVNMESGNLASSGNSSREVSIVGSFTLVTDMLASGSVRSCTRDTLTSGELFKVKGGNNLYGHLGTVGGVPHSINLATRDYAYTVNRQDSNVDVVGTFSLEGVHV